jgi:hypothetical protein
VAGDDTLEGDVNARLAVNAAELLANDTDADGDTLSIAFVGSPVGGSVSLNANQLIVFEPNEDFVGEASFQYIVTDGFALDTGNVKINIRPMTRWSNPLNQYDVDGDRVVAPNDVLEIINVINAFGSMPLPSLFSAEDAPTRYLDVTADDFVAPDDALAVVNYLNAGFGQSSPTSLAESESVADVQTAVQDAALLGLLADGSNSKRRRGAGG